jgi:serine phosphatase RsbU (regulator of sigma subunit)
LGLLIADVTGHGVPAALVASMVKIAFAAETERLDDPGLGLTNMNRTDGRVTQLEQRGLLAFDATAQCATAEAA